MVGVDWKAIRPLNGSQDEGFEELISCVATKGGITEEGVRVINAQAPRMFCQLFQATRAKHELVKGLIRDQR